MDLFRETEKVLTTFLAADSLAGRQKVMATARKSEELAGSSLDGPLPPHSLGNFEGPVDHPDERFREIYQTIFFEQPDGSARRVLVLVVQHGDDPPKVQADAFLDTFEDRLGTFTREPRKGFGTFHTVLEPRPGCYDKAIPASERKNTFRARPHSAATEESNLYASKSGDSSAKVDDPSSPLAWNTPIPCVVTVQWNQDDPERPFPELIRFEKLTWKP